MFWIIQFAILCRWLATREIRQLAYSTHCRYLYTRRRIKQSSSRSYYKLEGELLRSQLTDMNNINTDHHILVSRICTLKTIFISTTIASWCEHLRLLSSLRPVVSCITAYNTSVIGSYANCLIAFRLLSSYTIITIIIQNNNGPTFTGQRCRSMWKRATVEPEVEVDGKQHQSYEYIALSWKIFMLVMCHFEV